jgi:cysteinyl-tRNA synthetase
MEVGKLFNIRCRKGDVLKLYDTMSERKRPFKPLSGNTVRVYTCGPSVYAYSHIGNLRTYLFEDVLVRYLRYKGYSVKRVMNITDIEDKAIEAARKGGMTLVAFEKAKVEAFFKDFYSLGMRKPDIVAKASRHIPQMIKLIARICHKGYCKKEKDGVYFDARRFSGYGKLRHLDDKKYLGKAPGDDYSKEGVWDFRLWKTWTRGDGETSWESPFGKGRPGWHIECSAMAMHHLGESFDIHCGGTDNIYPHHENEIAQSESATGRMLANFWLHAGHLTIKKRKMSKRTGNVLYLKDLRKEGIRPECLRAFLLSEGYRKTLDFSIPSFMERVGDCHRVGKLIRRMAALKGKGGGGLGTALAKRLTDGFERSMDDDLDTKSALSSLCGVFSDIEKLMDARRLTKKDAAPIISAIRRIDSVLGIFF